MIYGTKKQLQVQIKLMLQSYLHSVYNKNYIYNDVTKI